MTLFGIVITTRQNIRSQIKDLLIHEGKNDISGSYLDKLTAKFSK